MGLTKQYLKFAASSVFNIIASGRANIVPITLHGIKGRFYAVGACEHVFVWDVRKNEKVLTFQGDKFEVTSIAVSPTNQQIAVGYTNGSISVFQINSALQTIVFNGHKTAVNTLDFNHNGTLLASGSKDTDIIIWDVVAEAGLFRLHGHRGAVTKCCFLQKRNVLVSSSLDTLIKFWDLDTQHCFYTVVGHTSEIWDMAVLQDESSIVTGTGDSELRIWNIHYIDEENIEAIKKLNGLNEDEVDEDVKILLSSAAGSFSRQGLSRTVSVVVDATHRVLGSHGTDSTVELFLICTEEEVKKRLLKKQKKERKKGNETAEIKEPSVEDKIRQICSFKASGKIKSLAIEVSQNKIAQICLLLQNNCIEHFSVDITEKKTEAIESKKVSLPGHRSDVRTVSFSSDNTAVLSASKESLKIWNRASQQCIRTLECQYALTSLFTPGDRHCVIGTKTGKLQVFDIAAGTLLESYDAHQGAVWSICLNPDQHGFISGGADKEVKFWEFDISKDRDEFGQLRSQLTIKHKRTLKMSEDVLAVKFSPNQKLIAIALLDSTVKVFFVETLKFFLSLYGHKLPILCMDISSDNTLIATGSADRNVKLWGLDFGDCHKSIFAHDDSIMCLQFLPKTHMFFTGGKDGKIIQWDGDSFEKILTLSGHHGEVWSLSISPNGLHLVTSSHDKSLRLWERTQEPLVLEEQQETEREEEYEKSIEAEDGPVVPGEVSTEASLAGKKTVETIKAVEKLIEGLDIYKEEMQKMAEHELECKAKQKPLPPPQPHPLLIAYKANSPSHFMLEVLKRIKSSELEKTLLVLPFNYVIDFINIIRIFLNNSWEVELSCRCLCFLLRVHHGQITRSPALVAVIKELKETAVAKVKDVKDVMNFNLTVLQFAKMTLESSQEVVLFKDATEQLNRKRKRKQKAQDAMKRAILSI